jgi:hypothetical protein
MNKFSALNVAAVLVILLCVLFAPRPQPIPRTLGLNFAQGQLPAHAFAHPDAPATGSAQHLSIYRAGILAAPFALAGTVDAGADWRRWQPTVVATPDIGGSDGALAFALLSLACGIYTRRRVAD